MGPRNNLNGDIHVGIKMPKKTTCKKGTDGIYLSCMSKKLPLSLELLKSYSIIFPFEIVFKSVLKAKYGTWQQMQKETGIPSRQVNRWKSPDYNISSKYRNILFQELGVDFFSPEVIQIFKESSLNNLIDDTNESL